MKKTEKERFDFVVRNLSLLTEHRIDDLYRECMKELFSVETHYYLEDDYQCFRVSAFDFSWSKWELDYRAMLGAFKIHIANIGFKNNEEKERYFFSSLFKHYFLKTLGGKKVRIDRYGLNTLLHLLWYIFSGTIEQNLVKIHAAMDKAGIGINSRCSNQPITIADSIILITIYKNGNIKLDGLEEKDWAEIERILELLHRHITPNTGK